MANMRQSFIMHMERKLQLVFEFELKFEFEYKEIQMYIYNIICSTLTDVCL